jgi:hypothetical protein
MSCDIVPLVREGDGDQANSGFQTLPTCGKGGIFEGAIRNRKITNAAV